MCSKFILIVLCLAFGSQITHADKVDDYVHAEMRRQNLPGLAIAIVKDGRIVKAAGYGFANLEWKARTQPDTVYQIQSITKQFTATAIMMLAEEGKLSLDDPVQKYLDGTPDSWKTVTIRHLLTHTSGIKDFINEPTASLRLDVSEEEVLRATAPRPLNFAVGERYAYSNTGYHLLAMIIRKISGKFYGDFLRERIFAPLGMTHTSIIRWDEVIPNRAAGYILQNGKPRNGHYVAASILGYGGGGIRSTVLDLAAWDAALYTEKLLTKSSLDQMWTPAKLNDGKATTYGFGWGIESFRGHRNINHSGGHMTGFSTEISRFVDDRLTVIVFLNARLSNPQRIARRIAGFYIPALAPPPRKILKLSPRQMEPFAGYYEESPNSMATLSVGKGRIIARHADSGVEELLPIAPDRFAFELADAEIRFTTNAVGQVSHATFVQNGRERKVARIGPLISSLKAEKDPDAALTARLGTMAETLSLHGAANTPNELMTPGARRAFANPQPELNGSRSLRFVSAVDTREAGLERHGAKVEKTLYYSFTSPEGRRWLMIHLTNGGVVADWDVVPE